MSRWLGEALRELLSASRNVAAIVLLALGHVVLDLVAAVAFLALLAWTLPLVIDGFNAVLVWWQDIPPPLPLTGFLCASAQAPFGAGLWASLLLFSTLIPTALHLAAVIASPTAAAATRIPGVHALSDALAAEHVSSMTLTRAAWVLALWRPVAWGIGIVFASVLLWGLFWVIGSLAEPMPQLLLTLALRDAEAAARCFATLPLPPAL